MKRRLTKIDRRQLNFAISGQLNLYRPSQIINAMSEILNERCTDPEYVTKFPDMLSPYAELVNAIDDAVHHFEEIEKGIFKN